MNKIEKTKKMQIGIYKKNDYEQEYIIDCLKNAFPIVRELDNLIVFEFEDVRHRDVINLLHWGQFEEVDDITAASRYDFLGYEA